LKHITKASEDEISQVIALAKNALMDDDWGVDRGDIAAAQALRAAFDFSPSQPTEGVAELIAEAKNYEGDNGTARWPSLIRELAAPVPPPTQLPSGNTPSPDYRPVIAPDQLREQSILRDRLDEELSLGVDAGSLEIMVQDWLREVLPERILTQLSHAERVELLGVRFDD